MRTPMAAEVAAENGSFKQVSQKNKEKRWGDCREEKNGPQGNWSQNVRAAFKMGMKSFVFREGHD